MLKLIALSTLVVIVASQFSAPPQYNHGPLQDLPPFLSNVSEDAKNEFKAIFDSVGQTAEQVKEKLDAWATENGLKDKVDEFVQTLEGWKNDIGDSTILGHKLNELPPFLSNVSEEARNEFKAIFDSAGQSAEQIKEKLSAWGSKYGLTEQVDDFARTLDQQRARLVGDLPRFLDNVSEDAKREFKSIVDNVDLTAEQVKDQLNDWATRNGLKQQVDEFVRTLDPSNRSGDSTPLNRADIEQSRYPINSSPSSLLLISSVTAIICSFLLQ